MRDGDNSQWVISPDTVDMAKPVPMLAGEDKVIPRDQVIRTALCGGRGQLSTSAATLYAAPSVTTPTGNTQRANLKSLILCNTDTSQRTATIYLVESGGSAADNRAIYKDVTIAAKTTVVLTFPDDTCTLDSGETVQGLADAASKVTYRINVVEIT